MPSHSPPYRKKDRILEIEKILFFHGQITQQQMLPKSTCSSSHLAFRWMPGLQLLQAVLGWSCILIQPGTSVPAPWICKCYSTCLSFQISPPGRRGVGRGRPPHIPHGKVKRCTFNFLKKSLLTFLSPCLSWFLLLHLLLFLCLTFNFPNPSVYPVSCSSFCGCFCWCFGVLTDTQLQHCPCCLLAVCSHTSAAGLTHLS